MKKHLLVVALVAASAGAALADDDCHVSMDRWQPREAVQKAAAANGWRIDRLKIDDGCYEIKGTDAEGGRFKAKLDPATLEIVKFKRKDDSDEKGDEDQRGERHDFPPRMISPGALPATGALLGKGAPPAAVVK